MYWIENIFFIMGFIMYELVMMPIAYIKIWINIIKGSMGALRTILNCIVWALIGLIMMVFLLFRDIAYLIKILSFH